LEAIVMKRMLALAFAWSFAVISIAHAVPARPLYEPPSAETEHFDFRGTVWHGKTYEGWAMTLVFEPSGVLMFTYNNSTSTAGSWRSEGNTLYMEMNKKYCEFRGVRTGNTIDGDSWNVAGLRWKTHLTQTAPVK
jgi:hypothetical protein